MNWPDLDDVQAVSPALAAYNHAALAEVWHRPQMSVRDRSLITVAALIARMQTLALPFHFGWALDHGVAPAELSEIITHLAFYSGWPHAEAAITAAKELFRRRGIAQEHLPPAKPLLLPLNEVAAQRRAAQVASNFGAVTPGLVENTTEVLFRDL